MIKNSLILIVVAALVAVLVSFATVQFLQKPAAAIDAMVPPATHTALAPESTFDRVMRTGVLRCGYVVWPPNFTKDAKTGEMGGIFYDYTMAMAKALNIKVEWTQEVGLATFMEDLKSQRYDAECTGGWPDANRAKQADYTAPVYYLPIVGFVRADDKRFGNNYNAINDAGIVFATIDGDLSAFIRNHNFPLSKDWPLTQMQNTNDLLLQVMTNKADVTFTDAVSGADFMRANPGKLRQINAPPLRVMPNNFTLRQNEKSLVDMFNIAHQELQLSGIVDQILDKYESQYPGSYYRVATPYSLPGAAMTAPAAALPIEPGVMPAAAAPSQQEQKQSVAPPSVLSPAPTAPNAVLNGTGGDVLKGN